MKLRDYRKLFSSLLALTIIFTMLFPLYGSAATKDLVKNPVNLDSGTLKQMKAIIDQEKSHLLKQPVLHPDLQNLYGDQDVSVIVGLSEYPVALERGINKIAGKSFTKAMENTARQNVLNQQRTFEKSLSNKGIKAELGFRYNEVLNGIAMKIKASQVKDLLSIPGVQFVEPDIEMKAFGEPSGDDLSADGMLNTDNPYLNVPDVWNLGYKGQGVKVGVIDTGIDYLHPELRDVYKGGHNFIDQSNPANYARDRGDDPYETTPLDRPTGKPEFDTNGSSFYTEHGTHVAGTIAAQGKKVIGIAPKVELYAYRVLGAYGSGANSGVIAGIEKAVQEKMDIINLSLGSTSNNSVASDAIAINNAVLNGTTAVVATGNSGPNRGTIGSPSTAAFAISVANSTVPEVTKKATVKVVAGEYTKESDLDMMAWKSGQDPSGVLSGEMDLVPVPGVGSKDNYKGIDVKDKVALVVRGDIPYVDKLAAAKEAGAKGIIIYNSSTGSGTPGPPDNAFLGDSFAFIPSFAMSYTDGKALSDALGGKPGKVTFSNYTTGQTAGDDVNSSSSRGPANPNFDLKPDITAPGTNIMSSVPAYGKDYPDASYDEAYDRFTGTSMATPHIAGVAALLKSQHPNWSPFDIKVAISNTAKQLDVKKFDVFAQGPGRVQPLKAATTEAMAYSYDETSFSGKPYPNTKGTVTFGNVPTGNEVTITKDITVKNLTGNVSDYSVTVETTKAATGTLANAKVTVDKSDFELPGSGEQALKVTLTVPKGTGSTGNELLGFIHITNGKTELILPFAANFAPPTGIKSYSIDSYDISPNGDGKLDNTTVRYEFYDRQYTTYIELWDASNPEGGAYEDGYLGYLVAASSTTTGPKTVKFDGSYTSWETGKKTNAPDGVYTVDLTTINQAQTAIVASAWLGPIFIKTKAPKIVTENSYSATSSNFELSGSIDDEYIDWVPVVEDVFGENFDVNSKLHAKYELTNSSGEKQEGTTPITLSQDGKFKASINGLTLGENKVKIIVDDEAQNSATKEIVINVTDGSPPVTTAKFDGTEGENGWYTSDVSVELTATDDLTGVKSTQYRVNGGNWQDYLEPIEFSKEGTSVLEYKSTDNAGNKEDVQTKEIKIDKTAPATKAEVTGIKDKNGWYTSDVTIKLSASDHNSGVKTTHYRVNNGEWKDYSGEIKLSNNGTFTVEYRSMDKAGNVEDVNSLEVKINKPSPGTPGPGAPADSTAPVTTAKVSGTKGDNGWYTSDVTVGLTATDDSSGVKSTQYRVNNGEWKDYSGAIKLSVDGKYTVEYRSVDNAGNTEKTKSVEVNIDKTAPKAPAIDLVSDKSTKVTGKTEANAVVKLYIAGKLKQSVNADKSGKYSFTISKQKAGTQIKVTATDKAGNVSKATSTKVVDKTPPSKPSVDKVTSKSTYVSGKAEKGSTVYVYKGKSLLGKGTANSKGAYKITIKAQKKGTSLTVYAVDKSGNKSNSTTVKVK
ncbi:S8 family serine peptidase [Bacillus sp. FJAT-49736]|uniref:OmpL47-type beta-barrel domain-containing protein n=1 Tax=Bacillus sp. FJAT-49736 TaxID=2833582 RepID=UPI001BC972A1|nr:S8 family serine peptidase [Bacillus sp. FJAT-49736]MBS4174325.1 S8 family serine peptidase [Bacillus sp. FJAT-49736]